jgi:thioredoxin 1
MENVTGEIVEGLLNGDQVVLVDYFAKWCGPCKMLMPRLSALQTEYPNAKFVSVDVDENTDHAIKMGIRSVPTVIIYKGSELIDRSSGANSDSFYKKILNDL